jgi:hypothetical protein
MTWTWIPGILLRAVTYILERMGKRPRLVVVPTVHYRMDKPAHTWRMQELHVTVHNDSDRPAHMVWAFVGTTGSSGYPTLVEHLPASLAPRDSTTHVIDPGIVQALLAETPMPPRLYVTIATSSPAGDRNWVSKPALTSRYGRAPDAPDDEPA